MGPTPTRTLGMRLSCNFVNVYTIVYHVGYSTRTRVHALIPNGHPREEKSASDKSPPTSRPARGKLNGPRAPRQSACSVHHRNSREEFCEEVRVSVRVRVGPVEFKLYSPYIV